MGFSFSTDNAHGSALSSFHNNFFIASLMQTGAQKDFFFFFFLSFSSLFRSKAMGFIGIYEVGGYEVYSYECF